MKRALGLLFIGAAALAVVGCAAQPQSAGDPTSASVQRLTVPPGGAGSANASGLRTVGPGGHHSSLADDQQIVARANGQPITMGQFLAPLIEAHGLPLLLNIVQLELARQDARDTHVTVSPQDIRREQELTMEKMFHDAGQKDLDQLEIAQKAGNAELVAKLTGQIRKDREQLLAEYLENQHYSRTEYDIVIEINAYLRKLAEPLINGRISDQMVQKEFGVEYGETVQIRYVQLANMQEVQEAQRRLKAGEDFAEVARAMSRNMRTAPLGGLMPAFSRQTPGLPDEFKQLAFTLQPGQVSDALNYQGNYYLMKLVQKFAPKAVKFESVKEGLRKSMYDRLVQATMEDLRNGLGQQAMQKVTIEQPELAKQFEALKAKREAAIRDRQKIDEQWKRERGAGSGGSGGAATRPTTADAPAAATGSTTVPPGPATAPTLQSIEHR